MQYVQRYDCYVDSDCNVYVLCQKNGWHKKGQLFAIPMYLNPSNGYLYVPIRGKVIPLHRIVAELIPNPDGLRDVDHIDRNKLNNNPDNLRWVPHSENLLNTDFADNSMATYGSRRCLDEKAYKHAFYLKHRDMYNAKAREKADLMRSQGKRYRKCPDGKHRWVKVEVA